MSSKDEARPPRRPQPDRDSFYETHAGARADKKAAPAPGPAADDASSAPEPELPATAAPGPGKPVAATPVDELPEAVILTEPEDVLPTAEISAPAATEKIAATRTDVRTAADAVVTEPFADVDDAGAAAQTAELRRAPEHLTADPLPYIEPPQAEPARTASLAYEEPAAVESSTPGTAVYDLDDDAAGPAARRGTMDLGLLILRIAVGLVFLLHGLQKLTTWNYIGGFGIDGFADFLGNTAPGADPALGFNADVTTTLAIVGGVTETLAGALLILGLLTPIAGAGALGVILVAMTYKATLAGGVWFLSGAGGNGLEFEIVLAAAAAALILCGPGLYSLDRRWGWARRPAWGSAAWLIIAVAAAIAVWVVFNGANPLARG